MSRYLTEDKSGIIKVVRPLTVEDFNVDPMKKKTDFSYRTALPTATQMITFNSSAFLSDLEKEVMFPLTDHYSKEENRYRLAISYHKKISYVGVPKKNQLTKLKRAQKEVEKNLKKNSKHILAKRLDELNAKIAETVKHKNARKLDDFVYSFSDASAWTWDEEELVTLDSEIDKLRTKLCDLIKKRDKIRYQTAMKCIGESEDISDELREHLLQKLGEKGSLENNARFMVA